MKEKGVIPAIIIIAVLGFLFLIFASQLLKFAVPAILVLVGFAMIVVGNNTGNDNTRKLFILLGLGITLFASIGGLTGFFSIIGTPFLTQTFSVDFSPSCFWQNCYNAGTDKMEGTYVPAQFSSNPFAETNLNQNYKIRAVSCQAETIREFGYTEENQKKLYGLVAQVQTVNGEWLDFYYNKEPISTVYQIPNSNEYVFHYIRGTKTIDLPSEIISSKVRCRITADVRMPRYGGYLIITKGTINVFGDAVEATCFDKIKNQNETEVDYGGICRTTEQPVPADEPTPIEPKITQPLPENELAPNEHKEIIEGKQVIVANQKPDNSISIIIFVLGLISFGLAVHFLRE